MPEFYLNNDFTTTKKLVKDPEPKNVSVADVVKESKKEPEPPETETVSRSIRMILFPEFYQNESRCYDL